MAKLPFALQLYSVRGPLETDLNATLQRVKAIGYDHVETAGLHGHSAAQFAASLADAGLHAISAHVAYERCAADVDEVIGECRTLGVQWAVIPWLSPEENRTAEDWRARAAAMAFFGARFRAAGISLCYHNHTHEFETEEGKTFFDLIFETAAPESLLVQLDVGWAHYAGVDPVALLKVHAGRVPLIHVKDVKMRVAGEAPVPTELGNGATRFAPVFKVAGDTGVQWLIVEQDESMRDPLESARLNAAYMRVHVY
ncbi:MAG: sugar phosphate isomerase/epimerase [Candidatus Hydrogenedentes bacterium]|nr:sugar phosphate isomerase/epimerase [Candidatus Hydrogenedentota bacterium]